MERPVSDEIRSNDVLGPTMPERETDEERYLYERLVDLRRSYELAAKPYIERLALADGARKRTEVVWLNPACSAALERSRGGLFAEVV